MILLLSLSSLKLLKGKMRRIKIPCISSRTILNLFFFFFSVAYYILDKKPLTSSFPSYYFTIYFKALFGKLVNLYFYFILRMVKSRILIRVIDWDKNTKPLSVSYFHYQSLAVIHFFHVLTSSLPPFLIFFSPGSSSPLFTDLKYTSVLKW